MRTTSGVSRLEGQDPGHAIDVTIHAPGSAFRAAAATRPAYAPRATRLTTIRAGDKASRLPALRGPPRAVTTGLRELPYSCRAHNLTINDPLVLAHARALLASAPEGVCDYVEGDLRDPDQILAIPPARWPGVAGRAVL